MRSFTRGWWLTGDSFLMSIYNGAISLNFPALQLGDIINVRIIFEGISEFLYVCVDAQAWGLDCLLR